VGALPLVVAQLVRKAAHRAAMERRWTTDFTDFGFIGLTGFLKGWHFNAKTRRRKDAMRQRRNQRHEGELRIGH
jgi:hypothetical protein